MIIRLNVKPAKLGGRWQWLEGALESLQDVTVFPLSSPSLQHVVRGPSSGAIAFPPGCSEVRHEVYTEERVLELFKTTHFDLILGERVEMNGMAILGTVTNVPVVNFEPKFLITFSQLHHQHATVTLQPALTPLHPPF